MNRAWILPVAFLFLSTAAHGQPAGPDELQQRWQWDRSVPEDRTWTDGALKIRTQPGRIWAGDGNRNLLIAKQPIGESGEAVADIELARAVGRWEQCGLLVYVDDDAFVKLVVEHIDGKHYVVMAWERPDGRRVIAKKEITDNRAQLRLRVAGDAVRGSWRLTGSDRWQPAAQHEFASERPRKFALFSQDGDPQQRRWAIIRRLSWKTFSTDDASRSDASTGDTSGDDLPSDGSSAP